MREATAQPPGWYPDPDGGAVLRRWDGARWTSERRAMPAWQGGPVPPDALPPPPVETPPPRSRWWSRRWLAAAVVVGLLISALALRAVDSGVELPPRTVHDSAFVRAANETCRRHLTELRRARPQRGTPEARDPGPDAAVADRIERAAVGLGALAGELRRLPVAPDDRPHVDGWLDNWDRYVELGNEYAAAVRAGDASSHTSVAEASVQPGRDANLFARANNLVECQFT